MDERSQGVLTIAKFTAYSGVLAGIVLSAGPNQGRALLLWTVLIASGSVRHFMLYETPGAQKYIPWTFLLEVALATAIGGLGYGGLDLIAYFVIISEGVISCPLPVGIALTTFAILSLGVVRIGQMSLTASLLHIGINGSGLVFAFAASFAVKREMVVRGEMSTLVTQLEASKTELESTYNELKESQLRLNEMAVTEERARLAREIHDTLAHSLTATIVTLEAARKRLAKGDVGIDADLATVQEQCRMGLEEVRRSVSELRPAALSEGNFPEALGRLMSQVEKWHRVTTEFVIESFDPQYLHRDHEAALFRIVQEACTNAVRHGRCSNITARLRTEGSSTVLTIEDDGLGSDSIKEGNGLTGMRDRLSQLGGTIEFRSDRGQGFTVIAKLPVKGDTEHD